MLIPSIPASWITGRRLRAHGLVLALCLWSVYIWNMATPGLRDRAGNLKGTDFLHFYTLGSLAISHRGADLYHMQAQAELAAQLVPDSAGIRYLPLYPPQVSIFFAPLAHLSYPWALAVWLSLTFAIYAACVFALWRACPLLRGDARTVTILALAFPAFWHLIAWGQSSALALACFTLAFFALRSDREFLAGLALGCLIFKPQLAVAAGIVFLITLRWKLIAGAITAAAAQIIAGCLYYGMQPLRDWIATLLRAPRLLPWLEPKPYQTFSLLSFWRLLIPNLAFSFTLTIISALLVLSLTILCWRSTTSLPIRYSALLLASALVAPHLTVYDLVILAPAFPLLADWCIAQPERAATIKVLLYLIYALPLLAPLTRWTHLQLAVPAMAMLLIFISGAHARPAIEEPS